MNEKAVRIGNPVPDFGRGYRVLGRLLQRLP
jgi:hypothetical protein